MQVFRGSEQFDPALRGCVVTIGNFDGLHLGHQALIQAVVVRARALDSPCVVYTFDQHPRRVLQGGGSPARLMTPAQLERGLREAGVDALVVEPFTRELSRVPAREFLEQILVARIAPQELFVGRDFRFGRDRSGTDDTLKEILPGAGTAVTIIPQVSADGDDVSSSRLRDLIAKGEVEACARALGRPYTVWGTVEVGDRRGRTLGFPTANVAPENELLPGRGVYATRVQVFDGEALGPELAAVTNVGTRPTFDDGRVLAEAHLLDFEGDLYGRRVALHFVSHLRAERRFSGPDELRAQIARDVALARTRLGSA